MEPNDTHTPSPETIGWLPAPLPPGSTVVVPAATSRTYTSKPSSSSPAARLLPRLWKVTMLPFELGSASSEVPPKTCVSALVTLMRWIDVGVPRCTQNTSRSPLVSPVTRLSASELNTMTAPLLLMRMSNEPMKPFGLPLLQPPTGAQVACAPAAVTVDPACRSDDGEGGRGDLHHEAVLGAVGVTGCDVAGRRLGTSRTDRHRRCPGRSTGRCRW